MVLDNLGDSLKETLKKIAKAIFVDERLIDELVKDIQKALLKADVDVKLVFELTKKIKERALNEKAPERINQKEHIIKIVYEELVKFLGEEKSAIIIKKKPFKIMMVGLYGSGKTTTIGKLATYYNKRGYKIATLALDVHRPAAIDQLEQISEQAKVKCFSLKNEKNVLKIYEKFKDEIKKYDILIIDTAGRDALSEDLIKEINSLNKIMGPDEKILVISADIGQAAYNQALKFHESCNVTSVIVTKLDGTAKGGGALSAAAATNSKVKFIGVGEKLEDLEEFNPKGFVGRLLGMGDLEALLEKAKEAIDEEKAEDLGRKFLKGDFNFIDLYEQMSALKNMGSLGKLMEMIPGMSQIKLPKDAIDVQEEKLEKWRYILDSMSKEELENPELLNSSRIERIAKGSGTTTHEVRELLKQYKNAKKLMKMMGGTDDPNKLMKKFKGKMPGLKF